jgi:ABC-type multidrug transport system fused ATPase/permease subunit
MSLVIALIEFVKENWPTIIVTLLGGFVFFLLSIYLYGKYARSALYERKKRAKESLVDIMESLIIVKKTINLNKFSRVVRALEREYEVELSDVSFRSILEDIELRIEKSKHLDPQQKIDYADNIEKIVVDAEELITKEKTIKLHTRTKDIIQLLRENVESGEKEEALERIEQLSEHLSKYRTPFYDFIELSRKRPKAFALVFIATLVFYVLVMYIVTYLFDHLM